MSRVLGIPGYDPDPLQTVDEVVDRHGDQLHALVGRELTAIWACCWVNGDGWVCTLPIVLRFTGLDLWVHFESWNILNLSWDAFDSALIPDADWQDDPDLEVDWQPIGLPELTAMIGGTVRDVRLVEHDAVIPVAQGEQLEAWILGGLELHIGQDILRVCNGLNETTLTLGPDPSFSTRTIPLSARR